MSRRALFSLPKFALPLILSLGLFAVFAAPSHAHDEGELAPCLETPGVPDEYGFTHQIKVRLNGDDWYFLEPPLELMNNQQGQPQDVPGHCWKQGRRVDGRLHFLGKHYNTGSLFMGAPPRFWSSDAGDHTHLFWADVIIAPWTPEIAHQMAKDGYVHQHELVKAGDGCLHPRLVVWFRHTALQNFTFDGGPPQEANGEPFRPRNQSHDVNGGTVDYAYPPQYDLPYRPENPCPQ